MVELFYDYASPYSFLANEMLYADGAELPASSIRFRPAYLRGFDAFKTGMPFSGPKLSWMIHDLRRCAEDLGLALRVPAVFPVNGLYALRGAVAAERAGVFDAYHRAVFRAIWLDGRDISNRAAMAALATELGFGEIATRLDDPEVKDVLKAHTDEAIRRGAFGVPTFMVGDELFWGHDRMHHVVRAVSSRSA